MGVMSTLELFNQPHIHLQLIEGGIPQYTEITRKVPEFAFFKFKKHIVYLSVQVDLGVLKASFFNVKNEDEALLIQKDKETAVNKSHFVHV